MSSTELNHISTIKSLLKTVRVSQKMHALIVEGPAGWGKTTAVDEAMKQAGVSGVHLGSAILKAATWGQGQNRSVKWGSTSSRAITDEFAFKGKLIIVCNSFPSTADAEAVRSRSFPCKIEITPSKAKGLIAEAAKDKKWYPDIKMSNAVAKFICRKLTEGSLSQISYRTLQMGYELTEYNPKQWEQLLNSMIATQPDDPKKVLKKLARQGLKVKDQQRQFEEFTGLKRRTFFKYRKELSIGK